MRIPEQVQLIATGQGNPNYTQYYSPSVTIVDVPLELLAAKCLEIVEKIANHQAEEPIHLHFDSTLLKGESTIDLP